MESRKLELGRAKSARNNAVMAEKSGGDAPVKDNVNSDGDILEVSEAARLHADNNMKNLNQGDDEREKTF